jgi:hypothetical protein
VDVLMPRRPDDRELGRDPSARSRAGQSPGRAGYRAGYGAFPRSPTGMGGRLESAGHGEVGQESESGGGDLRRL